MHSITNSCDESFIATSKLIGDKWSLLIVHVLLGRTLRFNELLDAVTGICPRTLSARLDKLEQAGIISKQVYAEVPARVEYSLTDMGAALVPVIKALRNWSEQYHITSQS